MDCYVLKKKSLPLPITLIYFIIQEVEEEDQNSFAFAENNPCPVPQLYNATQKRIRSPAGYEVTFSILIFNLYFHIR